MTETGPSVQFQGCQFEKLVDKNALKSHHWVVRGLPLARQVRRCSLGKNLKLLRASHDWEEGDDMCPSRIPRYEIELS